MPHSEIHGSKLVRSSPWLIAAYHVLHRLSAPRHPPDALRSLDCSHHQCPSEDGIDAELLVYINVSLWLAPHLAARACAQVARSAVPHQRKTPTLRPDFIEIDPTAGGLNTADPGYGRQPQQRLASMRLRGSLRSIPSSRCKRCSAGSFAAAANSAHGKSGVACVLKQRGAR